MPSSTSRLIEESINAERKKLAVPTDKFELDYGGFYSFHLFLFDDGVESSRTFRRHDLRFWGRLALDQGAHQIYVRSRLSFVDFNAGDAFDGNEDDIEGMNLERGFYQFDLARALQAYADKRIDYNIEFKIGRDLTEIGTDLVLSTPLDLVRLRATWRDIELFVPVGQVRTCRFFDGFLQGDRITPWCGPRVANTDHS